MKINIGSTDRFIRILVAVLIAILYFANVISGTMAVVLLIVAGAFIVTGFIGFCPVYFMFGIFKQRRKTSKV